MIKQIRPEFSTVIDPSEYDFDKQMIEWVKLANKKQVAFLDIDVGKLWGLYLAYKEAVNTNQELITNTE